MQEAMAMCIPKPGEPEVFTQIAVPRENPKAGEVGIAVKACGVNFADVVMRMGLYMDAPPMPFVPGYEIAGTVSNVGEGVTGFKVGDRVVAASFFNGYSSYLCVPARTVRPLPESMSFEEGAGVPVVFLTAHLALLDMARIRAGDRVLVHGIGGGVGLAALQLAKQAGCTVYGTAGSQAKLDQAVAMGLDHPINYRERDVRRVIESISGPRSLDVILEARGGDFIRQDLAMLRPTGRVVCFGASSMITGEKRNLFKTLKTFLAMRTLDLIPLLNNNLGVYGLNALHLWDDDSIVLPAMDKIFQGFEAGQLKTIVSATFPLEQVASAHRYLQDRKNVGKVVLTVA